METAISGAGADPRYKVLGPDGASAHGGSLAWSLPTRAEGGAWTPGEWHEVAGAIALCRNGLHLTADPMQWPIVGMRVFAAEAAGDSATGADDKSAHRRARLLHETPELVPEHWRRVERFVLTELPGVPWCQQVGTVDPSWAHHAGRTWRAIRAAIRAASRDAIELAIEDAIRVAGRDASWDAITDAIWDEIEAASGAASGIVIAEAMWAASRDAILYCAAERLGADLAIAERHRERVRARWAVWQAGYAVLGDVDGALSTYGVDQ